MKKLLLLLGLLGTVLAVNQYQSQAAPLTHIVTQRLTDRESTLYDVEEPEMAARQMGTHVVWQEYVAFDPPSSTYDTDLFYATLPDGVVRRLTEVGVAPGRVGSARLVVDESDNLYLVWDEDTGTDEGEDLFFWKTGMAAPLPLSNHDESHGDVGNKLIVLDAANRAHVLWAEATNIGPFHPHIFYWSEGGTTIKLAAMSVPLGQFNVTDVEALAVHDGVVRALWRDLDASPDGGGPQPFYWDSQTQTAVGLRDSDAIVGDEGYSIDFYFSEDGILHVLWEDWEGSSPQTSYYYYWNSASQQNQLIVSADSVPYLPRMMPDYNGNTHIFWPESGSGYHWSSLDQMTREVIEGSFKPFLVPGRLGNHIHAVWIQTDGSDPTHLQDLFYWRSDRNEVVNISDHTQTPADVDEVLMQIDETDTLHIFWDEAAVFYYNSTADVTTLVTDTLSFYTESNRVIEGETAEFGDIIASHDGVAYLLLNDTITQVTPTPYYVWQSDTKMMTPLPPVYGPTEPEAGRMIWVDQFDHLHAAWEDRSLPGESSNLHYWDALEGSRDLTDNADLDGPVEAALAVSDELGNTYVVWLEDDYDAQVDGSDLYAASIQPPLDHVIYLPIVLQP